MNTCNFIDTHPTRHTATRIALCIIFLVFSLKNAQFAMGQPAQQATPSHALDIRDDIGGVRLELTSSNPLAQFMTSNANNAPASDRFDELFTFEAITTPAIVIDAINASELILSAVPSKTTQQRQSLDENGEWLPADSIETQSSLPESPATIVREGVINGKRYVVIGISSMFEQAGAIKSVSSLSVQINGVRRIDKIDAGENAGNDILLSTDDIPQPARFNGDAWRIQVASQGIQQITGAQLAAAGIPMNTIPISHLNVSHRGVSLDIEVMDADQSAVLSQSDVVRFYAIQPGDRWNRTETFWLTFESNAGPRMATQAQVQAGTPTHVALMEDTWQHDSVYDSLLPGMDQDHWFSGRLNASKPAIHATLQSSLPFAAGDVNITVDGSSTQPARVQLLANDFNSEQSLMLPQTAETGSATNWSYSFVVPATPGNRQVDVQIAAQEAPLEVESLQWSAPVALSFNKAGAEFTGLAGQWSYQLDGLPNDAALYDVTDWQHPLRMQLNASAQFSAGPASRRFVLAGNGTKFEPAISKRETADLSKPVNARAIYIAPSALHSTLQPLIAHRLANGWRASIIDTQAIYDQWSDGQVSPDAIRAFLRYARATWQVKPYALILVGDGNYDPLNHTGSAPPSLVPPFLANVDPQMGETACESCFAQLDGNDVLSDKLPDLLFGRLPVKSAAELTTVVNKIIAYETQPAGAWMWRNVFIADNTRNVDGSYDVAGDFDAFSRLGMAQQPTGVAMPAMFYEPLADGSQPLYERDAVAAHDRTIALLNAGAAIMNYTGHGMTNQWAFTAPSLNGPSYLLSTQDAATLNNSPRLPVVLPMACLTGSFHLPSAGGNSIDEQLVLAPNGGAIASWSSAGLDILYSSEFLQRGFYKAVWQQPGALTIGALAQASLLELFQNAHCCDAPLRTHVLLGDPLTPLRITALPARVYAPAMSR